MSSTESSRLKICKQNIVNKVHVVLFTFIPEVEELKGKSCDGLLGAFEGLENHRLLLDVSVSGVTWWVDLGVFSVRDPVVVVAVVVVGIDVKSWNRDPDGPAAGILDVLT